MFDCDLCHKEIPDVTRHTIVCPECLEKLKSLESLTKTLERIADVLERMFYDGVQIITRP